MLNFTYPGKLTYKLLTHMMKIWSLIKDRVLAPNALQQVTVGSSFSLLTQRGTNLQQNYSSLNNMCFSIYLSTFFLLIYLE